MAVPAGPPILLLLSLRPVVLGGRRCLPPLSSHTPFMVILRMADNTLGTVTPGFVIADRKRLRSFRTSCSPERPASSLFLFRIWLRVFDSLQSFFGTLVRGIEL